MPIVVKLHKKCGCSCEFLLPWGQAETHSKKDLGFAREAQVGERESKRVRERNSERSARNLISAFFELVGN